MKYFAYEHLPEKLQVVSKPFGEVAKQMNETLPEGREKSAGLTPKTVKMLTTEVAVFCRYI